MTGSLRRSRRYWPYWFFSMEAASRFYLLPVNVAETVGYFLQAGNFKSLAFLDRLHITGGLLQRFVGACVEPAETPAKQFDLEFSPLKIGIVDVRDFELTPRGRFDAFSNGNHLVVIEVQTGDSVAGLGFLRFFLNADDVLAAVEFDYSVALRVLDEVSENNAAVGKLFAALDDFRKTVAEKDIVAKHQGDRFGADKPLADQERLGQPARVRLFGVGNVQAKVGPVPEQFGRRGRSWGVEMMRISLIPASIRAEGDSRSSACRRPGSAAC